MPSRDNSRCAVCGWPLADSVEAGCVRGNCSKRPVPDPAIFYDMTRAFEEDRASVLQFANRQSQIANHRCAPRTAPLVAPSYNHTSDEVAATGCIGGACLLGGFILLAVVLLLSWWRP